MATITMKEIVITLHTSSTKITAGLARVPRVAQESHAYLYDRDVAKDALVQYFGNLADMYTRKAKENADLAEKARWL